MGSEQSDKGPKQSNLIATGSPVTIRGITEDTSKKFGYCYSEDGRWHVAPYRKNGKVVAQHLRNKKKDFRWRGDPSDVELFGQHLWAPSKMVVITEGELDCLSVSEIQENRWPVVSIPNGVNRAHKDIANNLQWLSQFEKVILLFDDDDPGRKAALKAAEVLPVGKAYIGKITNHKDANSALMAGRPDLIKQAIWNATAWRPEGIVTAQDIRERILEQPDTGLPWFDDRLTELSYGRHTDKGQVWVIGAGTGIGKTAWLLRQMAYDLNTLKESVGAFFLETDTAEVYQRLAGIIDNTIYHLPGVPIDKEKLWETIESFDGRLSTYNSFVAADIDTIIAMIRYMAKAKETRIFYIDNMSQLTEEVNIRESVEQIVKTLKSLAVELRVTIMVASHLASPDKGSHEEGTPVKLRHFYGSRKLGAWIDGAIGLERNTQAEGEDKLKTTLRILKLRLAGRNVGHTLPYCYDADTDSVVACEDIGDSYGFGEDDWS